MSASHQWPYINWLRRETPLGFPIFTPFQVRPWTENCLFVMDAQIVRMVYIGGLSISDPTVFSWTLYWRAEEKRQSIAVRRGGFLVSRESSASAFRIDNNSAHAAHHHNETPGRSYLRELLLIEDASGLSRRQLATLLQTSHTTINGVAKSERTPRASLVARIAALASLVQKLASLHELDRKTMSKALMTKSLGNKNALDYLFAGDYEMAVAAAQFAKKAINQ